eukprot:CAMPEP_0185754144 /NCGR_PEP_ID=MMETSP1174-20130828/12796_1 /TAXON_ID=35687 /ORGANISM="Dictyocha speculum, Strain CCMP1381" /LENGTH=37 /DNA_ID= /DNA_START= /DNA_END= /DNA_ORIENTATION=
MTLKHTQDGKKTFALVKDNRHLRMTRPKKPETKEVSP